VPVGAAFRLAGAGLEAGLRLLEGIPVYDRQLRLDCGDVLCWWPGQRAALTGDRSFTKRRGFQVNSPR
jgi:hypothetical protein